MADGLSIDVYMEGHRSRKLAGNLHRTGNGFEFEYSGQYLKGSDAISVGPELPLTRKKYFSEELFPSFVDRLPSRENPAYPEYCRIMGIELDERDPIVLLSTLGRRGPSCFVFEPVERHEFTGKDAAEFRASLGLSLRDFGALFDFSPYTLQKIESGKQTGRNVLKRFELYARVPAAARFQMNRNRAKMHTDVWKKISERMNSMREKEKP